MLKLTDNKYFNKFFLNLAKIYKNPIKMKNSTNSTHTHTHTDIQARSNLNSIYFVVFYCFLISAYSLKMVLH